MELNLQQKSLLKKAELKIWTEQKKSSFKYSAILPMIIFVESGTVLTP